ncbi:MAG: ATP phosphoribosyltransferase [Candidatus Thorarchaeota archaeon]|jgi:ATP phosphoribosyltransferase
MIRQKLRVVLPKGRIFENVKTLLHEAGIYLHMNGREYRPAVNDGEIEIKIMKPQNIPKLVEFGSHHVGFTGHDWVVETGANVVELLDLGFDPVKIVAAAPHDLMDTDGGKKKIVVASEYATISRIYLDSQPYEYVFLRTYGATEVFPPDDADMIIDNMATGRTLKKHGLSVISTILESSTRFICNAEVLEDPWKKQKIHEMKMLFQSILQARDRVMLEMNIPSAHFDRIIKELPCMKSPTVAPLYGDQGVAVKIAVKKTEVTKLLPRLKQLGATDILEYNLQKVVV